MGFNKRYLNKGTLTQVFNARGAEGVIIYVSKADSVMSQDEFSSDIVKLVYDSDKDAITKLFTNEQS